MTTREDLVDNWHRLARQANYSVTAFASLSGLSVRQLERNCRRILSRSPKQLLNVLRLRAARELLEDGVSVKGVAYTLGYKRPEHFSRDFKKYFGISPSEVCQMIESNLSPASGMD